MSIKFNCFYKMCLRISVSRCVCWSLRLSLLAKTKEQVRSDNDASEVGILGHFGTFWDILGYFGTIRKTF